ncbi:U1 small nuclear ribonucleoprotein A [Nosema granulosis]|uniref:U1 small nuclear ribonucleoprotein A n=1 Tax=Nosema granulosis TaxID=83296 RepID=A0A9P6H0D4_9MICR|nr:U1 small nuclear ribonucleoprotein A [Nosema granulosis]
MLTLYIYNLNYKLPLRHLKTELTNLFTRVVRDVKIKMSSKHPGEAWAKFKNEKDLKTVIFLYNGFYFLDRKLKIEIAKKEKENERRSIIIKNVEPESYLKIQSTLKDLEFRYVEVKKVLFVDSEDCEGVLKILKGAEDLKGCVFEYSK